MTRLLSGLLIGAVFGFSAALWMSQRASKEFAREQLEVLRILAGHEAAVAMKGGNFAQAEEFFVAERGQSTLKMYLSARSVSEWDISYPVVQVLAGHFSNPSDLAAQIEKERALAVARQGLLLERNGRADEAARYFRAAMQQLGASESDVRRSAEDSIEEQARWILK